MLNNITEIMLSLCRENHFLRSELAKPDIFDKQKISFPVEEGDDDMFALTMCKQDLDKILMRLVAYDTMEHEDSIYACKIKKEDILPYIEGLGIHELVSKGWKNGAYIKIKCDYLVNRVITTNQHVAIKKKGERVYYPFRHVFLSPIYPEPTCEGFIRGPVKYSCAWAKYSLRICQAAISHDEETMRTMLHRYDIIEYEEDVEIIYNKEAI